MNSDKKEKPSLRDSNNRLKMEWVLAGILILLLIVAVITYICTKNAKTSGLPKALESESISAELPEGIDSSAIETQARESGEMRETEQNAETSARIEAPSEPETEETTEPQSVKLKNLSGLAPGTVLEPEQIDFDNMDQYFMSWQIEEGDNLYERINGKSYRANNHVSLSTLRYLKMPHYNFNGQIQVGEMIVNKDVQADVFNVFKGLFEAKYQIQSMYLVDNYWTGDPDTTDSASIDKNNTSAFCYREITGGGRLSNHAYGRAIDLNPQQNPYVSYSSGSPKWSHSNANDYIARDTGLSHVITHDDLAFKLFTKHGFKWGGDWNTPKDYQHFDKNN